MALVGTPARLVDVVGEYQRVSADHLCMDFAGNDPESYELFVNEVKRNFSGGSFSVYQSPVRASLSI